MYVCRNQAVASFHVAKKRLKKILFWKMVQNFFKKSIQFFFYIKVLFSSWNSKTWSGSGNNGR
jgi:hypothetical protein